jgi:ribosomal-protein-alanine N-acetyltransferase
MGREARIEVRRAKPVDVPAIAAIERETFPDPWGEGVFLETINYFPSTFFVAASGGEVIGFIVGGLEDTGELVYGHICNLAVTPGYHLRGVGRILLRRAEHQFVVETASGVQLEVRVSNTPAQKFYLRNGYREVFSIPQYYANGEDAIVMMKWFTF